MIHYTIAMLQTPRASIIIPVYNGARYLRECIDSAILQTEKNIEIIIVNDGSTDDTAQILESYTDARIHVFTHTINKGPGAARNTALLHASGTWCVFLDADDYMNLDRVDTLCGYGERTHSDVIFDNNTLSSHTKAQTTLFAKVGLSHRKSVLTPLEHIRYTPAFHGIVRRTFIQTHALSFLESTLHGEDLFFWMMCHAHNARVVLYPTPLYTYRLHESSLTAQTSTMLSNMIYVCEKLTHEAHILRTREIAQAIKKKKMEYEQKNQIATTLRTGTLWQKRKYIPLILYWYGVKYARLYI
jgi:succinoglycan biosynthesis protein ExoO